MAKSDLTLNILGFAPANRDLKIEILDPVSNTLVKEVQPFLDGTARISKIQPGNYELRLKHPNLTLPVLRRPIRVLPTGDTKISLLIDPAQFRDTPIADIPEANLTPIRQMAESVAETMLPLSSKQPGEAIKAEDWNAMAQGMRDLSTAIVELTRLVSPHGHDHTELIDKLDEISLNFRRLLDSLSAAMTELQRQIQSLRFRKVINNVLTQANVDPTSARGVEMLSLVNTLEDNATKTPSEFARKARNVGVQLGTKLEELIEENQDNEEFVNSAEVALLGQSIDLLREQRTTSYDTELTHHRRADRVLGAAAFKAFGGP